ncbi:N-6 DNA methylase [Sphingomonas sp. SUN039]|nr:N-6 DNA methylase [Sphingomonas sp. SUN039]
MKYQWHEIRARAAVFSERHAADRYENGDTQTFYNEFFAIFGVDRKQVAVYEQRVKNLPGDKQGRIDLFMPGTLIVEQKSAGLDLRRANNQALNYHDALPEAERPRYILTCDFQNWHLLDLETSREWRFTLSELKKHVEAFAFIVGVPTRQFRNQKPANPKATRLLSDLHSNLAEQGYSGHKLQLLLVRLLFILFADDTGIWPKDQFLVLLEQRTSADGRDLGRWLIELFDVLDTQPEDRQAGIDADLAAFPHINGKLFEERIGTAVFDNATRNILLDASAFNWGGVSPAIFGSLFEGVIDKVTRRKQGAHYTPEEAILKVIGPLFLDDLHTEFEALKARKDGGRERALNVFHEKLASLTFFDPACGAGNFLVVAYRELRELEGALLKEIHPPATRLAFGVEEISKINVDQFYGIEIDEFPSQIAQVALWMADHIANTNLGEIYGETFARIPLVTAPNIRKGDALEIDWADVLPPERCSFVFGNPPFIGAKYQSEEQRAQVRQIAKLGGSGGTLDYVAAWFLKSGTYVAGGVLPASPSSRPIRSVRASRWPSSGRSCSTNVVWKSPSPIAPSSGRAARRCIASSSGWRTEGTSRRKSGCSAMSQAKAILSKHELTGSPLTFTQSVQPFDIRRSQSHRWL